MSNYLKKLEELKKKAKGTSGNSNPSNESNSTNKGSSNNSRSVLERIKSKLNDRVSSVDEKYLNDFISDVNSFSRADEATSYGEWNQLNLGGRATNVRAWLDHNKSNLDESAYKGLYETIDNIVKLNKYYSQWDSEDEYSDWYKDNKNRLEYESVLGSEDLEEYSKKGASVSNPDWDAAHAPIEIFGWKPFGDGETITNMVTFAEANAQSAIEQSAQSGGAATTYGEIIGLINNHMKDDEKRIYNYYVGKGDTEKANEYLTYITDILRQRQAGVVVKAIDNTALEAVFSLGAGTERWFHSVGNLDNLINGTESDPTTTMQYAHGTMSENNEGAWKVTNDLLNTTGNMLPSILVSTIPGVGSVAGKVALGAGAAGGAYSEMRNLGYDENQARGYAAGVAASEVVLQSLLGGIGSLGGKYSLSSGITKLVDKFDHALAKFAIQLPLSMGSEALEEGIQTVLEPAIKSLATGEDFEAPEWEDVFYSALLGALSAGTLEGVPGGINAVASMKTANEYRNIYGNDAVDLVAESLEIDPNNAHAQKMQAKLDKGKKLSGYNIAHLVEANENALVSQDKAKMKSAVEARLTELGEEGDVSALAEIIVKKNLGEKLTRSESKIFSESENADWVADELSTDPIYKGFTEEFSNWAGNIGTERINTEAYNRGEGVSTIQGKTTPVTKNPTVKENATEAKLRASTNAKVTIEKDGETVTVKPQKIASIEGDVMTIELEGGEVVDASDVDFGESQVGLVYQAAKDMTTRVGGFNIDTANVFVRGFTQGQGLTAGEYVHGFSDAYRFGKMGYPVSELARGVYTSKLTEEQRNTAYNFGKAFGNEEVANKVAKIASTSAINAGKDSQKGTKKRKGRVHFDGKVVGKNLTERQKASLKGLGVIAEAMGMDIHVFESPLVNGKRQGENGWYNPVTHEMGIDLHAGVDGNALMLFTGAHELSHHIKEVNPVGFKVFADALFEEYDKHGISVEDLIQDKLEVLEKNGRLEGKTEEQAYDLAYEEVVADACEAMLVDSNAFEALSRKIHEQDKGLWQTIKDFIAKLVARIKAAYKGLNPDSYEANLVRKMADSAERLQKLWVDALLGASEVQFSAETTLLENGISVDSNTESGSLFSVRDVLSDADRKKVSKALATRFGVTQEEAVEWLNAETSLASLILNPKYSQYLDYTPDPNEVAIKQNFDYPQGTVDFSPICAKRREFTAVMNNILRLFPNHVFAATDLAKIRTIMQEEGMTIPCGICYVEDRRQLDTIVAQNFIDSLKLYREGSKTRPDGKPFNTNQLNGLKLIDGNDYTPSIYELVSLEGLNLLKEKNPQMAEAWVKFNNARGMQAVRLLANEAEYKRQILKYNKNTVKSKNDKGGLRVYSFSDMEMFHLIDIIQVITDSATVGLSLQGYTKVNEYAKAVKDTGEKLNRSLIPKGDLGYHIEDGKVVLDYDTVEGIDINHPDFFDNMDNPNIGNITIGVSDVQIRAAMVSDFVDQIIPFHTGQSEEVLGEKGISTWDNYKDFQKEKDIATGTASDHQINIYTEVLQVLEKEGKPITKRTFVEKFLQVCKENNLTPRFSQFLNTNEHGEYTYTEGYHKFLVDFKTFDQRTGEYLPQMPVKPIFDNEYITKLLKDYVKSQKVKDAEIANSMPTVIDRITKEIVNPDGVKHSDRAFSEEFINSTLNSYGITKLGDYIHVQRQVFDTLLNEGFFTNTETRSRIDINAESGMIVETNKSGIFETFSLNNYGRLGKFKKIAKLATVRNLPDAIKFGHLVMDDAENIHDSADNNKKFAYIEYATEVDGKEIVLKLAIKKSPQKNKFWVHSIYTIENVSDSPASTDNGTEAGHITADNKGIIPQDSNSVKRKFSDRPSQKASYSDRDSYAPTFYSHMGRVIDDVKLEKMGTSSILNHLKNRGVKDEEIKWSGIEAFLEGKKSVTKAELQEFVAGSQLQIEEEMSNEESWNIVQDGENYIVKDKDGNILETWEPTQDPEDPNLTGWISLEGGDIASTIEEIREYTSDWYGNEGTGWSQYRLDGGTNYRELVFKMPNATHSNRAMRAHWGQDAEGVLVHARIQDFIVDGKKMLFIEEIQSDWHNEGHQKGYTTEEYEEAVAVYDKLAEDYANKRKAFNKYVRSGEFRSDPDDVSKKKFDWLRRKMDEAEKRMQDAERDIDALKEKGMGDVPDAPFRDNYHEYVLKRLLRMATEEGYDSIGWTPSEIQSERWSEDYTEGYRIEYDQDIPKFLRKYGKRWGATVGTSTIGNGKEVWSMDITDSMKDSVLYEGQVMYSDRVIPTGIELPEGTKVDKNGKPRSAQAQRDAGYMLSESKFLSLYNVHKIDIGKRWGNLDEQIEDIKKNGFKGGSGTINIVPSSLMMGFSIIEGKPKFSNVVQAEFAPRKGDKLLFVPENMVKNNMVAQGFIPLEYEVVTVEYDYQPYYESYTKAYDEAYKEREFSDVDIKYSIREESPPKKTKEGYKVFVVKNGKLYPPMVANPNAEDTPVGVWLNADIGTRAPDSKTGRMQVKAGGKGTQGGSGSLAFRPGWHLGETPLATQFDRLNPETGVKELFPENFVWALCDIAADHDYQEEAMSYGYTKNGKFQHSLAGLPKLPVDGYYKYRTNPNPDTVPWLITGAMKVKKLLSDAEVNAILTKKGLAPKQRVGGEKTLADLGLSEYVGLVFSDRTPNSYSNRSLLANALESTVQNDIERDKLRQYKEKIDLINAEEEKLHELREKIKELSFAKGARDTERIKALQFEANQAANRINTYDRQLLNLESTKALKGVLDREKAQARKRAEQRAEQRRKDDLAKAKERATKTQRELMNRYQESRKKGVEGRKKTEMRHKIKGIVSELNTLLLNPTAKKHIKEELRKEVADALSAINMDTVDAGERVAMYNDLIAKEKNPDVIAELTKTRDRIQLQGDNLKEKLNNLQSAYEKIKNTDDIELNLAYQEVIQNSIKAVTEKVGNTSIRNMTLEQLEMVYDLFKMIRHTIRDANKSFKEKKGQTIMQMAEAVNDQVRTVGGQPYKRNAIIAAVQRVGWTFLKPYVAFRTIGSITLTNLYKELRNGEDTFYEDVKAAQAFIEEQYKKHGYKSWDMKKTKTFTAKSGKTFDLTLEQMMTLYAYSKREQAHKHIIEGGIVFEDALLVEKNKLGVPIKYEVTTKDAFNLSEETFAEIANSLTAEQKAFVDAMQAYLSVTMGAKGNEVSMELLGVKLFKEEFYLPIKSSQDYMNFSAEEAGEVKLKSPAFSKETVKRANNPIVLHNFTDLWAEHINDMSMYHSFVLALEDFTKVYNYKTKTDAKVETMATKATLETAYPGVTKYINKFLKDMNGGVRSETVGWAEKLTSLSKKGSVLGSASVTIQQPSAVMRAMGMVNPKYFVTTAHKSFNLAKHKQDFEELKKYAPIAGIKEMGRFDVGMGQGTVDWIKSNKTVMEKGEDILSFPPALMDEITWVTIWNAVKRETANKNPKLSTNSDEFLKLAGDRFTDVISLTQVYDSVFSRSDLMRNKSWIAKAMTAFMAEPTTTLNMIWDGWVQAKRTGGFKAYAKATVTTGAPIVSAIILNAALKSIIMAMRDDDEDESYAEKYLEHFVGEIADNLNPLTLVPLVKDVVSIFKGYDVERMDMALFSDLKKAMDAFNSEDKTLYEKWSGLINAVSAFFGVPVKNVERDIRGLINTFFGESEDTTAIGILNAIEEGWTGESKSNGQQLYEAMLNGDSEQIKRVKGRFKDQSAINTAIRKALRENDPRIKEAADARYNGDIAKYMKIAKDILRDGKFKQDDVVAAINSEINDIKKKNGEVETSAPSDKVVSLYKIEDYYTAIVGGDDSTAYAVKYDLIETDVANGKSRDDAEASFDSKFVSHIRDLHESGEVTDYKAREMLVNYGGKTADEAESKVQYWNFKKQYPDYDLSEESVKKYYSDVKPSGISVDVYYDYSKQRSKAKGVDLNGDGKTDSGSVKSEVLRIINSLPISYYQKDVLYYLNGWSRSTIWEAPWH